MPTRLLETNRNERHREQVAEALGATRPVGGGPWPTSSPAVRYGWTPAHGAAARFLGGCFAVGAVLGVVTEMARPIWGQRHG